MILQVEERLQLASWFVLFSIVDKFFDIGKRLDVVVGMATVHHGGFWMIISRIAQVVQGSHIVIYNCKSPIRCIPPLSSQSLLN